MVYQKIGFLFDDHRPPLIAVLLFALLLIYSLWQCIDFFINQHSVLPVSENAPVNIILPTLAIADQHLFGAYNEDFDVLPRTSLPLNLQGIALSLTDPNASRALIAAADQVTHVYKVGDLVAGVTIQQIFRDRVILRDHGRLESLSLPVPKIAGTITDIH